jgi:hypothetical protein
MKLIGATLFASALALAAGCSSGSSSPPRVDDAATSSDSLVAPNRPAPEDDPCARVRCAAGTECVVVDGQATCAATDASACAAVLCPVDTTCEVIDGEPNCTPIETDASACAAVLCPVDTTCEVIDGEPNCTPIETDASACAAVLCPVNTTCEVIDGIPNCTPITPDAPLCGGFAGLTCPGEGTCVDDPSDNCDPENGGADCGGICECNVLALCVEGFVYDASPEVCACVEDSEPNACALVLCPPNSICEVVDDEAVCKPIEPPPGPFCGGFGGFPCPGAGTCVDDPTDTCDPDNGGADCGGICECNVLALCVEGFAFDPSPEVCACVESPELDPCAVVRCPGDTECVVNDGVASCEPIENPCNLVDCIPDTICRVIDGEPVCVPCD